MNTIQLFTVLLTLMVVALSALGHALHRMSAAPDRDRHVAGRTHCRMHCSLALEPSWTYCPLCGQVADQDSPLSTPERSGAMNSADTQAIASASHSHGG